MPKRIATLAIVVVAVSAFALRYWHLEYRAAQAQEGWERALAKYDAGLASPMEVCVASFRLLAAENVRWFQSASALDRHINRLDNFANRLAGAAERSTFPDRESLERERQRAEDVRDLSRASARWNKPND